MPKYLKLSLICFFALFICVGGVFAAVNGECGSADTQTFDTAPTEHLCSSGTAGPLYHFRLGTWYGGWIWYCAGMGGTTKACYAYETTADCGSSGASILPLEDDVIVDSKPTTNLCSVGTASSVSEGTSTGEDVGNTIFLWTCNRNWSTVYCYAKLKINGACGTANGGSFSSKPKTNLCEPGLSLPAGLFLSGSTWTWTCEGIGEGTTSESCSANKIDAVNGVCGSAATRTSIKPTSNLCSTGTSSTVLGTGPWTWTCSASGGTTANCTTTANQKPVVNIGSYGPLMPGQKINFSNTTASDPESDPLTYIWSCSSGILSSTSILKPDFTAPAATGSVTCSLTVNDNLGGQTVSIVTIAVNTGATPADGICGTANRTYPSETTGYGADTYCSSGTPSSSPAFPAQGSSAVWHCDGINGGNPSGNCTAAHSAPAAPEADGVCGSASGHTSSVKPTTNLCADGSTPTVSGTGTTTNPWTWVCAGSGGGDEAHCSCSTMPLPGWKEG